MILYGRRSVLSFVIMVAAYSAERQNQFIKYSKLLFDSYHNKDALFSINIVKKLASTDTLDIKAFENDFNSDIIKQFIKKEYDESEKLGIVSTPTIYLNNRLLNAGQRRCNMIEGLVKYIEKRGR